jgi:NAD(P)H-dependent flavin oxidoreductase YrpB (nitropropane dioxygenase family)
MEVEVALVLRSVERDSKTDPRASLVMRHHRVINQRLTVSIEQVQQTMNATNQSGSQAWIVSGTDRRPAGHYVASLELIQPSRFGHQPGCNCTK